MLLFFIILRQFGFMKDNEPMSGLTHLIGMLLSIAGLVLLIVFASLYGSVWHVVAFSIFGVSLTLLYLASTIYHFIPKKSKFKNIFRKIDHSMIYILIAGTYTPVTLILLRGGWGWSLFGVIWGIAIFGIILKVISKKIRGGISTLIYLLMGWLVVIAWAPLIKAISFDGLIWLVIGGLFYTFGTIFFGLETILPRKRWIGMHEVFHVFVVAGSFSHFWLMFKYIVYI